MRFKRPATAHEWLSHRQIGGSNPLLDVILHDDPNIRARLMRAIDS
jgi:hypothetical protein